MIYLAEYRTHQSVEELKQSEYAHIKNNKLSGNTRKVLEFLVAHSLNNLGACKLKAVTIAESLNISRSTVMRAIKRLKDLDIIAIHNDKKLNGIKGANIYSIFFCKYNDTSKRHIEMTQRATHVNAVVSTVSHVKTQDESLSLNSFSKKESFVLKNVIARDTTFDLKQALQDIYKPFTVEECKAFEELSRIAYGRLKQYMRSHNMPYHQMTEIIINCMYQLIDKDYVRNQFALYSSMIKRQVEQLFEKRVQPKVKNSEPIPKWFNKPSTIDENEQVDFEAERLKLLEKLG